MMRTNILLNLEVRKKSRYSGDWRAAIDEAYDLSKELGMGCSLNFLDQYSFTILPTMSQEEVDKLKEQRIVIGM